MKRLVGPILHLTAIALLISSSAAASESPAPAYTNHTVGGPAGWLFNATTNDTSANYTAWALTQTFNLGDYLIFNTNSNQSVIETYNETTFRSCSVDDASDDDTFIYDDGDAPAGQQLTIEIPLTNEGKSYYFSGTGDGVPCSEGMAFEIQVNHGLGLPPSLNQPPPPPYTEAPDSPPSTEGIGPIETPGNDGARSGTAVGWGIALVFALPIIALISY